MTKLLRVVLNSLNRQSDADALVARGKSIADAYVRNVFLRFVVLMDSLLRPDHLGLALETNLIRGSASAAIYDGAKTAANAAATVVRIFDANVNMSVSVQVDYAWGKINGLPYIGVDQDVQDFPFLQELGYLLIHISILIHQIKFPIIIIADWLMVKIYPSW